MEKPQSQYHQQSLGNPGGAQWMSNDIYPRPYHHQGQFQFHDQNQVPEDPKERWRRHFRYTLSIREEKNVFKRFFQNLKIFLLDCWLDIITVLITIAVAAAVRSSPILRRGEVHIHGGEADETIGMGSTPHPRSIIPNHLLHFRRYSLPSIRLPVYRADLLCGRSRSGGRIRTTRSHLDCPDLGT